jgi:hypothetical protein
LIPGHGLRGIERRMSEIGGVARFVTKPGLGFEVSLRAPLAVGFAEESAGGSAEESE